MLEALKSHPAYPELSGIEIAICVASNIRQQISRVIYNRMGLPGRVASALMDRVDNAILMAIHDRTGLLDKVQLDSRDVIADLTEFKREFEIDETAEVVYIGSSNDTCVRRLFPQTLHIDIHCPRPMPREFRFQRADAAHLPHAAGSVDIIFFKAFGFIEPDIMKELRRVLKTRGKILFYRYPFERKVADLSYEPQTIEELRIQEEEREKQWAFNQHGFRMTKEFSHGTALLERTEVDPAKLNYFEQSRQRNRRIFYQLIEAHPDAQASSQKRG